MTRLQRSSKDRTSKNETSESYPAIQTLAEEARNLYREARELHLIFVSMYRK